MKFPTKPTAGQAPFAERSLGHAYEASSRASRSARIIHAWAGMVAELGRARSPRAGIKGPGGFTFVEVLAAMLFMSIVIPVAMQGIQIANRAGVVAARKSIAVQLADKLLNEAILTSNSRSSGQGGSFPDPHKDYRWRQSQKNWTEDTMREITVEVFYMVQNQEYSVALTTLVTQDTQ